MLLCAYDDDSDDDGMIVAVAGRGLIAKPWHRTAMGRRRRQRGVRHVIPLVMRPQQLLQRVVVLLLPLALAV